METTGRCAVKSITSWRTSLTALTRSSSELEIELAHRLPPSSQVRAIAPHSSLRTWLSLCADIDALANALEADLGKHKEQILRMMLRCVIELPTKTPVYGTLAGLLNVKNMDFGSDLGTFRNCFSVLYLRHFLRTRMSVYRDISSPIL